MSGQVNCKACGRLCTIGEGGWNAPYCSEACYSTAPTISSLTRERDEARAERDALIEAAEAIADRGYVPQGAYDAVSDACGAALARLAAAERVVEAARELFDALHEKDPDCWWDYVTSGCGRSEEAWEALSAALNDTAKSGEGT